MSKALEAYIIGAALGDGNLSSPNGRATRLRITCARTYPNIALEIESALKIVFPKNKVSRVERPDACIDLSVYSNQLNSIMPWQVGKGTKIDQSAHIPTWITSDSEYKKYCIKGLIQTDGCIYIDRGYTMVHFTNCIPELSQNVYDIIRDLGWGPHMYKIETNRRPKYVVRLSKNVDSFLETLGITKS